MIFEHLILLDQHQPNSNTPENNGAGLTERDIIYYQSLLMAAGGITFKAINSGEITDILAALVHTAYTAVEALNRFKLDLPEHSPAIYQIYQMLPMMQVLSEKIHHCSSGKIDNYLDLYNCCSALATNFLNADFDKAFFVYHQWRQTCENIATQTICDAKIFPDLTDCLYE